MKNGQCFVVMCFLVGVWSAAIRAAPVIPDGGLIMRESSKMPKMPKNDIDAQFEEQLSRKKPMVAPANLPVTVRSFSFTGNSQISDGTLQSLLSDYLNRKSSFADLQKAAAVINNYYRKAGFLFSFVYLPEQSLEHGHVELVILEGILDDNQFEK